MTKLKHTFKTDILFKLLFVKYPELLKELVANLLSIRLEDISEFKIINTDVPPEIMGNKFCRLDINMIVNGQLVDLEVEVDNKGNYPERSMYYLSRQFSNALPASEDYSKLPRAIIISIMNYNMFNCEEYYSKHMLYEETRHTLFSDKMCLIFYELKKLPSIINAEDMRELWLMLFKAETREDLKKIHALGVPIMEQAINAYNDTVISSDFRELERLRVKARHDEAQALRKKSIEVSKKVSKKWEGIVAEKDAAIAEKDATLAVKDTTIAEKEAENEKLRKLVAELQAKGINNHE